MNNNNTVFIYLVLTVLITVYYLTFILPTLFVFYLQYTQYELQ